MKTKSKYTYRIVTRHDVEYIEIEDEVPNHHADEAELQSVVEKICSIEHKNPDKTKVIYRDSAYIWESLNRKIISFFRLYRRKSRILYEDYERFYHD